MTYPCTVYMRPDGTPRAIDMVNIYPEDEAWFRANNVRISMEEDGGPGVIAYADIGLVDDDGEPDEMIEFSAGRNCEDTMAALRRQCEERKAKERT